MMKKSSYFWKEGRDDAENQWMKNKCGSTYQDYFYKYWQADFVRKSIDKSRDFENAKAQGMMILI